LSTAAPVQASDWLDRARTEQHLSTKYVLAGRYEIQQELGAGGLGVVYLAHDRSLDMDVAIKVLKTLLAADPQAVDGLKKEARIAMRLSHKNIMRVHNFEDHPEIKFLTMEYIDGATLAALTLRESAGKLPSDRVIGYVRQICEGLEYAHEHQVIHRDIKPSNIMVNREGVVKIADFGIARVAKDSVTRLSNMATAGTLLYMSPEQIKGRGVDAQSDLYSLGAAIYELLSGHPPFYTGDIQYQVLHEAPEPIEAVPPRINEIVLKALAKNKEQRWRSARELLGALDAKVEVKVDRKEREPKKKERKDAEPKARKSEERPQRRDVRKIEDEGLDERLKFAEERWRKAAEREREQKLREQERVAEPLPRADERLVVDASAERKPRLEETSKPVAGKVALLTPQDLKKLRNAWILATMAGWALGWAMIGSELSSRLPYYGSIDRAAGYVVVSVLLAAVAVGLSQWLVLRRYVGSAGPWFWITALGWVLGWAAAANVNAKNMAEFLGAFGAGSGLAWGLGQWLLLRHWKIPSAWWSLATLVGVIGGISIGVGVDVFKEGSFLGAGGGALFGMAAGAVLGAVTGVRLMLSLAPPVGRRSDAS
jgi:hypothetical protein